MTEHVWSPGSIALRQTPPPKQVDKKLLLLYYYYTDKDLAKDNQMSTIVVLRDSLQEWLRNCYCNFVALGQFCAKTTA